MKNFINLTSRIINKLHIIEIRKKPDKYYIHMSINSFDGVILFTCGSVSNNNNIIEICKLNNKNDYDIISDFINKNKN